MEVKGFVIVDRFRIIRFARRVVIVFMENAIKVIILILILMEDG